ncbi:MAG: putative DNA-binding domain-containing protein [Notoacmeibacter sp.]|nr:putative DNA-binding domain-containing protein [Notoacmeibacter sp.]MCC0032867.1 putative DNA-binding domain-containing protein [Brucellaceae bacterium]
MPSPVDPFWQTGTFAGALTDPDLGEPGYLAAHHGGRTAQRFNVYRNNVVHSLVEALGQVYPAVRHVTGGERFAHVARLYMAAHPPRSSLLFQYGEGFGDFLDRFAPAREQMPWLGALARLERAWLDAWHAADASALDAALLAAVSADDLPGLRFIAHPATRIVPGEWAVADLFRQARQDSEGPLPQPVPESVLVTRPDLTVMTATLLPGEAALAAALLEGVPLEDAAETGFSADPGFDFSQALARLLAAGAFSGHTRP